MPSSSSSIQSRRLAMWGAGTLLLLSLSATFILPQRTSLFALAGMMSDDCCTPTRAELDSPLIKSKHKRVDDHHVLGLDQSPRRYRFTADLLHDTDSPSDAKGGTDLAHADLVVEADKNADGSAKRVQMPTKEELATIFEIGKEKYESEETLWKLFVWTKPDAHRSLSRIVNSLDEEELELRSWIRTFRQNPDTKRPPTVWPTGGDLEKWGRVIKESQEELGGVCAGATWLNSYKALHEEILSGRRPPSVITYHCELSTNCGGLSDRLLGMTSAFLLGLVTKRAFFAEWQTPTPLDVIFDSPFVNWSMSTFVLDRHPVLSDTALQLHASDLDLIHFRVGQMDATFNTDTWSPRPGSDLTPGMEQRDLAFQSPWIKFFSNRGFVYRSFSYPNLQKRLDQLGLRRLTAASCLTNYLFRPKPAALEFITEYTSVLSLPSIFSVGIQIRTGDASMKDPTYDKTNTVQAHRTFFKCAEQLAETYMLPDQRLVFFLVTDSASLREDAVKIFGDRVLVSGVSIEHVHQTSGHAEGVYDAVLEQWILAKTDYRVITDDSGFGKVAAFLDGRKSTTVAVSRSHNRDQSWYKTNPPNINVDCRLESAFVTFERLSSRWALG